MTQSQPIIPSAAERPPGRTVPLSSTELHVLAAVRALPDAGVALDEAEGLVCAGPTTNARSIFLSEDLVGYLGLTNLKLQMTCQLGGGPHLAMSRLATRVIAACEAETVLVVSARKFPTIRDGGRELMGPVCLQEYELPHGASAPTLYGLIAQASMHETGQGRADAAAMSASQDPWNSVGRPRLDLVVPVRPRRGPVAAGDARERPPRRRAHRRPRRSRVRAGLRRDRPGPVRPRLSTSTDTRETEVSS